MNFDELQNRLLARFYLDHFLKPQDYTVAEEVAEGLKQTREQGSRAGSELVAFGLAISPFLNRNEKRMRITALGILEAEQRGLADPEIAEAQGIFRYKVVEALAKARETGSHQTLVSYVSLMRELGYTEEDFHANADVLVSLKLIEHGAATLYRITNHGYLSRKQR